MNVFFINFLYFFYTFRIEAQLLAAKNTNNNSSNNSNNNKLSTADILKQKEQDKQYALEKE